MSVTNLSFSPAPPAPQPATPATSATSQTGQPASTDQSNADNASQTANSTAVSESALEGGAGGYTALADASASTVRGGTLNVVA